MVIDVPVQFPEYLRCKKLYLLNPDRLLPVQQWYLSALDPLHQAHSQLPYHPFLLFR